MTIIKVSKDGKKVVKKVDETVVPLHVPEAEPAGRTLHVEVMPSERSKRLVNIFLLIIALLVLSAGIVGSVYLYKYMAHRHRTSKLTIHYVDDTMPTPLPRSSQRQDGYMMEMQEEVDILVEEEIEKIDVPKFDDCRSSVVIHDFHVNVTVIVDNDDRECFLMDLDRTRITPPRSFAELISKYASGYYMPKVDVVRRNYRVVTPPLTDLGFAGSTIRQECHGYASYKLEKKEQFYRKERAFKTFGFCGVKDLIKDQIYK